MCEAAAAAPEHRQECHVWGGTLVCPAQVGMRGEGKGEWLRGKGEGGGGRGSG